MSEVITDSAVGNNNTSSVDSDKKEDDGMLTNTKMPSSSNNSNSNSSKQVYVCYLNRYFVKHEIYAVFDDFELARQWTSDVNKKILQIEGMEHAAETRYKDKDPAKYKQVLGEAERFRAKSGIPEGAWLATMRKFELNTPEPLVLKYNIE